MTTTSQARLLLRAPLLAALQGLGLKGAWEGQPFQATVGVPYVRETLTPAGASLAGIGPAAKVRHPGVYLIDVFVPASWTAAKGEGLADAVEGLYWPGRSLGSVRCKDATRGPTQTEADWRQYPVSTAYFFDTLNPE